MTESDLIVEASHAYHEANAYADKLAKFGHSIQLGTMVFDRLTPFISLEFFVDSSGTCRPWIYSLVLILFWVSAPLLIKKKEKRIISLHKRVTTYIRM